MTRLRVDMTRCDAYGYCAELLPERISLDQWGYPMIPRDGVEVGDATETAQAAVHACPRKALFLLPAGSGDDRRTRVMLVHGSADNGVSAALAAVRDIRVVGHACSDDDAVRLADRALPDVVLIDLSMLGFDGIETTRRLLAARGGLRVVMLSTSAEPAEVNVAVDAGAIGYLQTDAEPSEIAAAVRSAARGETPFSALAAKGLLIARAAPTLAAPPSQPRPNPRQSQPVWIRAGAAFAVGAVAAALVLSLATGSSSPTVWSAHVVSKLTELAAPPTAASAVPTAASQIASAAPPTPATTIAPVPAATPEPSNDSGRDRHEGGAPSGPGSGH